MRIGAHISTRGDYAKMFRYAEEVGCETFAIFAKSPRIWSAKPLDPVKGEELRAQLALSPIEVFYTHTAYLINISSAEDDMRLKSSAALADELVRAALLGASGVNTHMGNDALHDDGAAAQRAADSIVYARETAARTLREMGEREAFSGLASLSQVPPVPRLLLEDTAGAGSTFGATVEQLAATVAAAALPEDELGICLDTCHAWAQGYDVSCAEGWTELLDEVDDALAHGGTSGIARLGLLHANDSKFARGAHKDRHEQIGKGAIGEAGFSAMVCEPRLSGVDVILEVPGEEPDKDIDNIALLKRLRESA